MDNKLINSYFFSALLNFRRCMGIAVLLTSLGVVMSSYAETETSSAVVDPPEQSAAPSNVTTAPSDAASASPAPVTETNVTIAPATGAPVTTTSATAPVSLGTFSPIKLFQQADTVGKSVILLLIFGSLLSWTLWLVKTWEVSLYRHRLKASLKTLSAMASLKGAIGSLSPACNEMLALAKAEFSANINQPYAQSANIKERVHARIQRLEAAETRILTRGASILATTSAVAPFVGLFGTVWGIMHSFISIAQSHTTNLSVVAPGIAEALFATALGLVVAVPSVIFYNMVSRNISGYRLLLADAATLTMCLLSQELDKQTNTPHESLASVA